MNSMLILHIHDRLSLLGGADWHLISILDCFPTVFKAAALYGRTDNTVEKCWRHNGFLLKTPIHFIKNLDKKAPFSSEKKTGDKLRCLIDAISPDIIHVHNILNPYLLKAAASSAPSIITVQDHRYFCPGRGKIKLNGEPCFRKFGPMCAECFEDDAYFTRILELVEARMAALECYKNIIVLSKYMKKELVAAGLNSTGIKVISPFVHGLDRESGPASQGVNILFAGRIVWAKGVLDVLEAFARVRSRTGLIIAGSGTIEDQLNEKIQNLQLSDKTTIVGWAGRDEMSNLYRNARLVALPSRWQEPFGITGLEALAMGRPAAAYDVGGVGEWLGDDEAGKLIAPGDVAALGDFMEEMIENPEAATRLGEKGRALVDEKFNREKQMAKLKNLYIETAL